MHISPLFNKGNILSFGDDLSGGSIKKPTPIQFLNCWPLGPLLPYQPKNHHL